MKLLLLYFVFALLVVSGCIEKNRENISSVVNSIDLIDDRGDTLSLESPPERIISLAPNITEMIYALKFERHLVGNTTYCYYPEAAKNITKVGDMLSVDYETIATLKPDLIFVTMEGNTLDVYNKLRDFGYKVFVSNPRTYDGIKKTFRDIAKIFNGTDSAETKIQEWDKIVYKISSDSKLYPKRRAMFMVSVKPIMIAGGKTFVNEFLNFCNLENIAQGADANYPLFTREEVLKRDPEILFYTQKEYAEFNSMKKAFVEWDKIDAIKNRKVFLLDPDLFFRPGPRFPNALRSLFDLINSAD